MTNRNTRPGKLPLWLLALAVLAAFQPGPIEAQNIEQTRKAAAQGDAEAQFILGLKYTSGEGVPQDHSEAVKWYRKAAEQGLANAQYNLGFKYYNGEGVPQDHSEAVKWWALAAAQGDAEAQYILGIMYSKGEGVPQDFVKAQAWLNLAAAYGDKEATKERDKLREKMTSEQVAEAQRLAANLFKRIESAKSD